MTIDYVRCDTMDYVLVDDRTGKLKLIWEEI